MRTLSAIRLESTFFLNMNSEKCESFGYWTLQTVLVILEVSAQSKRRPKKLSALAGFPRIVTESVAAGAKLVTGGEAAGSCYLPTILTGMLAAATCLPFLQVG